MALGKLLDVYVTCYHSYSTPEMDYFIELYFIFLTKNAFPINRMQTAKMFMCSGQSSVIIFSPVKSAEVSRKFVVAFTTTLLEVSEER
jgi:hypothetical protein